MRMTKSIEIARNVMSWLSSSQLPPQATDTTVSPVGQLHDLRQHMLALLDTNLPVHNRLAQRVRFAADANTLWYLRSDLMGTLAAQMGEQQAAQQIKCITEMFQGLVPSGLMIAAQSGAHRP